MSWQSGSINPATTSPLADIGRIKNDLSVLKGVLGGTQDADVPFTPYAWPSARITGDFSNATLSNRVMFQTSTANGDTSVGAIPNGTSVNANFSANSSADPTNASRARLSMTGVDARLSSDAAGTGTYLPMTFYTGGAERMRIDTSGFEVTTRAPGSGAHILRSSGGSSGYGSFYAYNAGNAVSSNYIFFGDAGGEKARITQSTTGELILGNPAGLGLQINPSGSTVHNHPNGGLGYGIGAGGTVTQSTSKSTAVTLNKPCGQITMNNAALAAGAEVFFTVNNTLLNDSSTTVLISPLWSTVSPLNYQCRITYVGANTLGIAVKNISAGSLSEALVINFAIIKGASS